MSAEPLPIEPVTTDGWGQGSGESVYWDRAVQIERDKGSRIVQEADSGSVIATAGEHQRIVTGNLTGCRAIAVVLEGQGTREAYIQHFKAYKHEEEVSALQSYLASRQGYPWDQTRMVILAPGQIGGTGSRGLVLPDSHTHPYQAEHVRNLVAVAQKYLMAGAIVQVVPYKVHLRIPRTFIVDLAADGGTEVTSSTINTDSVIPSDWSYDLSE